MDVTTKEARAELRAHYGIRSDGEGYVVTALLDALDRAEATIARLTAEVTDLEAYRAWEAAQPEIPPGLGCPVSGFGVALTAFLEARKGDAQ